MGWLYRKFREAEWIWSLWNMATGSAFFWSAIVAAGGVMTAAVFALSDSAQWISQFGRTGWILATAATIILTGMVIVAVTSSWNGIRTIRQGRRSTPPADALAAQAKIDARESKRDEALRRIERAIFLLLTNATDEGTHRALWRALKSLPDEATGVVSQSVV